MAVTVIMGVPSAGPMDRTASHLNGAPGHLLERYLAHLPWSSPAEA
jgi:hypothetical protein